MRTTCLKVPKCIFCDSTEGDLRKVLTFQLERKVKQCVTILEDSALLGKLSAGVMTAKDAMYHSYCLLTFIEDRNRNLVFLMTIKLFRKKGSWSSVCRTYVLYGTNCK